MNKGVKHEVAMSRNVYLQALISKQNSQTRRGAGYLPAPRTTNREQQLLSVTTVRSGTIGYGPSRILRARNDLIEEAALVIFGDYLDAWPIATCVDLQQIPKGRWSRV